MILLHIRSFAEFLSAIRYYFRCIKDVFFPYNAPMECGESNCTKPALVVLSDKLTALRVYVCGEHYLEIRKFKDWDVEPA